MSKEIVVAEPIYEAHHHDKDKPSTSRSITVSSKVGYDDDHVPEPFESERLPPTLDAEIRRFLRVANLIERKEPRIAYLCKLFCVFWINEFSFFFLRVKLKFWYNLINFEAVCLFLFWYTFSFVFLKFCFALSNFCS